MTLVIPTPSDFTIEVARGGGFDLFRRCTYGNVLVDTFDSRSEAEQYALDQIERMVVVKRSVTLLLSAASH